MRKKLSERFRKSVVEGITNVFNIFEGVVVEAFFALFLIAAIYTISYLLILVV
ncbi:MAG: hypothetical protein ACE5J5_07060 [Candidatus Hydrothermarchaeales archaeon]